MTMLTAVLAPLQDSNLIDTKPTLDDDATLPVNADSTSSDDDEDYANFLTSGIRHVDSLANFQKHCQQQQEAEASLSTSPVVQEEELQHQVTFSNEPVLVHIIPPVTPSDFARIWFTTADFERQEQEVKMTCFRWENHQQGHIPFDEQNNSIRGLEHLYRETKDGHGSPIPSTKRVHRNAVMAEIQRQRTENNGKILDLDKIRQVSLEASQSDRDKCLALGKADHEAAIKAWEYPVSVTDHRVTSNEAQPIEKKKKKGKALRFWKKK